MSAGAETSGTSEPSTFDALRETVAARWRSLALAAVGLLAAGFAHREFLLLRPRTALAVPLSTDVENWFFEPSDTSPPLVVGFVAWLLWRRRARLAAAFGRSGPVALSAALLAAAVGIFVWALRTDAPELQAFAVFFELLGVANLLGGIPALRVVALPAVCLMFAMPLPSPLLNEIVWKFQIWTAEYTGFLLGLLGRTALVSGDQLILSSQVFQIIETCSGLRAAETLAMLSVLMVDLFRRRGLHAALVIAASLPVAFVINGFRALGLIFNPHSDVASIHNLQGILMLLSGVLMLYAFDGLLERLLPRRPPPPVGRARDGRPPVGVAHGVALAGALALLVGLSLGVPRFDLPVVRASMPASRIGHELAGWHGTDVRSDRIFLGQAGFSHILHRSYERGGEQVNVFVATATLARRYRSFWSPKTALPSSGWIVEERQRARIGGRDVEVQVVRRGTRRLLVYHWREESLGLAGEALRAALALDASPLRRERIPVVVRLHTPIAPHQSGRRSAEERLQEFVRLVGPAVKETAAPRGATH